MQLEKTIEDIEELDINVDELQLEINLEFTHTFTEAIHDLCKYSMSQTPSTSATTDTTKTELNPKRRNTRSHRSDSSSIIELRPEKTFSITVQTQPTSADTQYDYDHCDSNSSIRKSLPKQPRMQTILPTKKQKTVVEDVSPEVINKQIDNLQEKILNLGAGNIAKINKKDMYELIRMVGAIKYTATELCLENRELKGNPE
ncbi:hypothetical protein FQA39_LY04258 [Lamprigera yunnana]|nr:hypothetical protein FQA39_LY04258 [Lamprigera yunnana]